MQFPAAMFLLGLRGNLRYQHGRGCCIAASDRCSAGDDFRLSTKRLSLALPAMEKGTGAGLDSGLMLFIWNTAGAMATIFFIYAASWFDPDKASQFLQGIRKLFCGTTRMKLLCFLPGCREIEEESLRRLYVWLMVPLLGIILLGVETGLSASTSKMIFGSYRTGLLSLLIHGIIEIPAFAFALAGAITYSGHLAVKPKVVSNRTGEVFSDLEAHRRALPIKTLSGLIVVCLLIAGMIEAHVTSSIF